MKREYVTRFSYKVESSESFMLLNVLKCSNIYDSQKDL